VLPKVEANRVRKVKKHSIFNQVASFITNGREEFSTAYLLTLDEAETLEKMITEAIL